MRDLSWRRVVLGAALVFGLPAACYSGLILPWRASAEVRLAESRLRMNRFEEARQGCERALALKPSLPRARAFRSILEAERGHDPSNALLDADRALLGDPLSPIAHEARALALFWLERQEEAVEAATRALELDPRRIRARRVRAMARAFLSDPGAFEDARTALDLAPAAPEVHSSLCFVMEDFGQEEAALREADAAVALDPEASPGYVRRAYLRLNLGRRLSALEDARRASDRDQNPLGMLALAAVDRAADRMQEALADLGRLEAMAPGCLELLLERALVERGLGETSQARSRADQALSQNPSSIEALLVRASIDAQESRFMQAEEDWARALQLAPNSLNARLSRGSWRLARGATSEARRDFDEACGLNPKSVTAAFHVANWKANTGDSAGAIEDCTRILRELSPKSVRTVLNRAFAELEQRTLDSVTQSIRDCTLAVDWSLGEEEAAYRQRADGWKVLSELQGERGDEEGRKQSLAEAEKDIERALKTNPASLTTYTFLASTYLALGRLDQAAGAVEEALRRAPWYSDAYRSLAEVELARKRYPDARKACERALERNPNNYQVLRVQGRIDWQEAGAVEASLGSIETLERLIAEATGHWRKAKALVSGRVAELCEADAVAAETWLTVVRGISYWTQATKSSNSAEIRTLLQRAREELSRALPHVIPGSGLEKSWKELDERLKKYGY